MSPDQTLRRDPHPVLAARAWMVWVAVFFVAAMLLVTYQWGYSSGAKAKALDFAEQVNCRADLAQPLSSAAQAQQAAFGDGMVAGLLGDDPVIAKQIKELTGKDPDELLADNAAVILEQDKSIRRERKKHPHPVQQCKDGKP